MRILIIKNILKYVTYLLGITVFLSNGIQISFANKYGNNHGNVFLHKNNNDDDDDEGDDDDSNDEEEDEDESHNAGRNCLTSGCHAAGGEERFYIGGTIYTDANGTDARVGAKIKVTDANGKTIILTSDSLGNFYSGKNMTAPFTITASYQGRAVEMPTEASSGGCNADGCHVTGSAGRVFISTNDLDLTGTVNEADTGGGSSEISYNSDIKSILDAKCISCHKSGGAKSDTPLTTYAEVTDSKLVTPGSAESLLIRKLNKDLSEGTMWKNLNSTSEYRKIKNWIVKFNAQEYSSGQGTTGTAVSGAKVRLSQNGSIKYKTTTDSSGTFTLEKVKAGEYTLKVSRKGYKKYSQTYQMNQGSVTPLEITLQKKK